MTNDQFEIRNLKFEIVDFRVNRRSVPQQINYTSQLKT